MCVLDLFKIVTIQYVHVPFMGRDNTALKAKTKGYYFFFFLLSFHVPALKKNICGAGKLLFWPCFRQLSLQKSDSAASFAAAVGVTPSRNDLDESPLHQRANR